MKLYYAPGACSLADHIALIEAGLDYELAKVDLKAKRVEDGQDYTAVNPKGYVPALQLDSGDILTENIAILSWIGKTSDKLHPADEMAGWRMIEMLAFISTELHKNYKPFFKPDASDIEKDEARQMLAKRFAYVSDQLDGRDFIIGDALSLADCYLFVMLSWAKKNGLALPGNLEGYFDGLKSRPGFARALQEEGLS